MQRRELLCGVLSLAAIPFIKFDNKLTTVVPTLLSQPLPNKQRKLLYLSPEMLADIRGWSGTQI